ncbi:tetratricopeptide repeat protein [Piscinibacter sakaiensis]|uniref:TPR repeat domain protein n=1 Tax=Piscinibacter sakaiensis TaxID=1547922 RepID=A0A0K8P0Q9_PISS1|nr:tetratricopeptide repeat protein [Piscinibacter sakaiensis]GAP36242.1 TPR repeat domain protein [Piscinibacter sakaiensis]
MTPPPGAGYTLRQIEEMLGLRRSSVLGLVRAGFVSPGRGPRNEYRFGFQDVVLLRTAHHLRAAQVSPRRMLQALRELRRRLPASVPMTGLRIQAVGSQVAVREGGGGAWRPDTGQWLMDFELSERNGQVHVLAHRPVVPMSAGPGPSATPPDPAGEDVAAGFARAEALEDSDPAAAEAAYRAVLDRDPAHAHAALNLGALLCEVGRADEACRLLDAAIARHPDDALLHFNLAIAREDSGQPAPALAAYERALALDGDLADAHYNAARLHEAAGDARAALRHLAAYRRLQREAPEAGG